VDAKGWDSAHKDLKSEGAEFVTGVPKDVYIDAMLTTPIQEHPSFPNDPLPLQKQPRFNIRYVPDADLISSTIDAMFSHGEVMVDHMHFSALPNGSMSDNIAPVLDDRIKFSSGFTYTDRLFVDDDGTPVHEHIDESPYAGGQRTRQRLAGTGREL
jgi:hypothetical protein